LGVSPGEYFVSCIGLVDKKNKKRYLFDATPDLHNQLRILENFPTSDNIVDGIFLTHAHIGHYTGLMYLGREGLGGNEINVFALKRMSNFLQNNGPWDQLVDLNNISLNSLENLQPVNLSKDLKVIPIKVPHRDEYSETVGYKIAGKTKKVLFIPDIDKWSEWERDIIQEVKNVDYALIDGTFYNGSELNRDMSEIPHPSIEETIGLFLNEPIQERNKIYFIHINHTNPILTNKNNIKSNIENFGFNIAQKGLKLFLD
jgi:pyrroloquinoline quinone biosynthesis protein B